MSEREVYGYGDFLQDLWNRSSTSSEFPFIEPRGYTDYIGAAAAESETVTSQLPGRENGPADAYRHILWAAEMTRRFGEEKAREILELHERDGSAAGQPEEVYAMEINNNEIGIEIGKSAKTFEEITAKARKVMDGSLPDGSGDVRNPTAAKGPLAQGGAMWLSPDKWRKNPLYEDGPKKGQEMPTEKTNWHTNPQRPHGIDWKNGIVHDAYLKDYRYGGEEERYDPANPNTDIDKFIDGYRWYIGHGAKMIPEGYSETEPPENETPGPRGRSPDIPVEQMTSGKTNVSKDGASRDRRTLSLNKRFDVVTGASESSPAIRAFLTEIEKPGDALEELLLKRPAVLTEPEMKSVLKSEAYWRAADPRHRDARDLVQNWFDHHYGREAAPRDAAGQIYDPGFRVPPIVQPTVPTDPDGRDVAAGIRRIGQMIADRAGTDGLPQGVRLLQAGLNLLDAMAHGAESPKHGKAPKIPMLKVDGVFGPKTKDALRRAVAGFGRANVENGMALARFDKFARQAQARDSADGLRDEAHAAFAPLFGGGLSPHAGSRSKQPWGLALQDTVNDLGTEAFDKSRWTPLRDDGWIGPKTTDAFAKVLRKTGSDRLTRTLGANLGFF